MQSRLSCILHALSPKGEEKMQWAISKRVKSSCSIVHSSLLMCYLPMEVHMGSNAFLNWPPLLDGCISEDAHLVELMEEACCDIGVVLHVQKGWGNRRSSFT